LKEPVASSHEKLNFVPESPVFAQANEGRAALTWRDSDELWYAVRTLLPWMLSTGAGHPSLWIVKVIELLEPIKLVASKVTSNTDPGLIKVEPNVIDR
jgi:hypothetical protein